MDSLERVVMAVLLAILGGFALSIAIAVLRRRINVRGLVSDETGARSPARWQLLFITVAAALSYLVEAIRSTSASMPELPGWFTSAMLASNAVYLFGKGGSLGAFNTILSGVKSLWRVG